MKHFYLKSLLICLFASCMDISAYAAVPQGDGSLSNPFNTSAALNKAQELAVGETSSESYYIQGKISRTQSLFSEQFGTAIFWISDDGSTSEEFYIYATYFLENTSWVEGCQQIAVGDDVVIYGKLANYRGTLETASRGSYIYSLNGKTKIQEDETPTELKAGDLFTAKTIEDINMTFSVVNPEQKTCQVGGAVPDQEGYYYITIDKSTVGTVTIPEEANGYKVVGIERVAFSDCQYITGIVLPKELMYIHGGAFENCKSLSQINIPERITSIESATFYGCSGLTTISLPNNLTSIDNSVFYGCSAISSITIPERVTFIGSNAFEGCSNLTTITINSNTIVSRQYTSTQNLATLFGTQVKGVILGEDITEIGAYAFAGLSKLVGITIPKNTTNIGQYAFSGCSNLTNIIIPEQVTSIGGNAFSDCPMLTSVTIDSNKLASAEYVSNSGISYIFGRQVKEFVLGNSVLSLGNSIFRNCNNLETITIPESVTSIGNSAFEGCSSLISVVIPNSVTTIGYKIFKDCSNLSSVSLSENITQITYQAFYNCWSLSSIVIGKNATSIGVEAFDGCGKLATVTLNSDAIASASRESNKSMSAIFGDQVQHYIIGNDVTSLGYNIFNDCSNMTSITIGNGVKNIASFAFEGCSGLKKVIIPDIASWCNIEFAGGTFVRSNPLSYANHLYSDEDTEITDLVIPNGVTSIANFAFYDCDGLISVTIPESVISIDHKAFYDCDGLISVSIPKSVKTIGNEAFSSCGRIKSLSIPGSVENIGDKVFAYCENLNSLVLEEGLTDIGNYEFFGCIGLTGITIPNSVASIGKSAFEDCNSLSSVTIGESVTSIGEKAFAGCTNLASIHSMIKEPFDIEENVFNYYQDYQWYPLTATLHVPSASASKYSNKQGWNQLCITEKDGPLEDNDIFRYRNPLLNNQAVLIYRVISAEEETCHVTGYDYNSIHGSVKIPMTASGFDVIGIDKKAFSGCDNLTIIDIPESVTSIGARAFEYCPNLDSYVIDNGNEVYTSNPNNVIMEKATNTVIAGCNNFLIPDNATGIGEGAFAGCTQMTAIEIPSQITHIEKEAFYDCCGLQSVKSAITEPFAIDISVFQDKNGQPLPIQLNVPFGTKELYQEYSGWNQLNIEDNVYDGLVFIAKTVEDNELRFRVLSVTDKTCEVYRNGSSYVSPIDETTKPIQGKVTIPEVANGFTVTRIGSGAFSEVSELTGVTIPNTVTRIDGKAFYGCNKLTSLFFPASVIDISNDVPFYRCQNLTEIIISGDNPKYDSRNNCNAIIETATNKLIAGLKTTAIPNTVTAIGGYAFDECVGLTSIDIPNSIISIGSHAFSDCEMLTDVVIPNSVLTIGEKAFSGCMALKSIVIPESVTSIGVDSEEDDDEDANGRIIEKNVSRIKRKTDGNGIGEMTNPFSNCINLSSIKVDEGNKFFDSRDNCNAIIITASNTLLTGCKKTVIPSTVTSIGTRAFKECKELYSIVIPNSVVSIGRHAFEGCTSLKDVDIPNSVVNIDSYAFNGCSGLTNLAFPFGLISIGWGAFQNCHNLTSIHLPKSIESIGKYAFYDSNPDHIYSDIEEPFAVEYAFPATYISYIDPVGNYIGKYSNSTTILHVPYGTTEKYRAIEGWNVFENIVEPKAGDIFTDFTAEGVEMTFMIISPKEKTCMVGTNSITQIAVQNSTAGALTIPESAKGYQVTRIGSFAFFACTSITDISIPGTVTQIGISAFGGCSNLISLSIPEAVTDIDNSAFERCTGLSSVSINCPSVGSWFRGNTSIQELTFGEKVSRINDSAFQGCSDLTSVTISGGISNIGKMAFGGCDNLKKVNISDISVWCRISFEDEKSNPLYYAKHLCINDEEIAHLIIPDDVTSINKYAFNGCSGLASVSISGSITHIDNTAFAGCTGLSSISINCPTVGSWFSGNTSIQELTFGDKVSRIDGSAFYGCRGLTTVNISRGVTSIGNAAFYACDNLNKVNISDITSWCGISFGDETANPLHFAKSLFIDGEEVKSLVVPNGTTGIGAYAFDACESLTSVVIPNTVKTIGANAFRDCINLRAVTSLIDIPFKLDDSAFTYSNKDYPENTIYMVATLYVPRGRDAFYGQTDGWKRFAKIEVTDTKYKLVYVLDGEEFKSFEIQATEVVTPEPAPFKEGYTFSGWSDIPWYMPAEDVTVTGSFTVNQYVIRYYVGEQLIAEDKVDYGSEITLRDYMPEDASRYSFAGWDGQTYTNMPAHDIEYRAIIVDGINAPASTNCIEAIYDEAGRKLLKMQRGINIVRMSDGTTRKVLVK